MPEFEPKRIPCAVDLSSASIAVLSWASLIAEAFASHVEILHASWSDLPRYFTESQDFGAMLRGLRQWHGPHVFRHRAKQQSHRVTAPVAAHHDQVRSPAPWPQFRIAGAACRD